MARLPTPGGDNGNWGTILNEYLSVELDSNGILKKTGDINGAKSTADNAAATAQAAQTTADTTRSEFASHAADTTNIHGIGDTSLLETASGAQAKVNTYATTAVSQFVPVTSTPQLTQGLRWVFFGDSITNGSSASNFSYSFISQALQMVGPLVAHADSVEAGTPGDRLDGILARMDSTYATYTDVTATFILAGTNDAGVPRTVAAFAADMTAAIAKARRHGAVIVATIPPRGTGSSAATIAATDSYNIWINANAAALGVSDVANFYTALVDNTTGLLAAAYDSGDAVHSNNLGHYKMAQEAARAMKAASGRRYPTGVLTSKLAATLLITPDPLVVGGTVRPVSWFEQPGGTGTAPTYSLVSDTSGVLPAGRWAQVDFDAVSGGTRILATAASTNWAVGDKLAIVCHVQIEDVTGTWVADVAAQTANLSIVCVNQSGVGIPNTTPLIRCPGMPLATTAGVYDIGPVLLPFTVPAGTTSIALWFQHVLPTGKRVKFRYGCAGLLNLTNLGLTDTIGAWSTTPVNI